MMQKKKEGKSKWETDTCTTIEEDRVINIKSKILSKMYRLIVIIILLSLLQNLSVSQNNKDLYSGGMLIFQPAYTITQNPASHEIKDVGFGIGGVLRFYFLSNFTAGVYGGSLNTNYETVNSNNSYINIGYGGPFIGFSKRTEKIRYTLSGFIGRGTINNLHIEQQSSNEIIEGYLYNYSTILFSPMISVDINMTERIALCIQAVSIMGKYKNEMLYNPSLQIGVLFNR